MIYELLSKGPTNARTARELADVLGCTVRDITRQIEKERRDGRPICANTQEAPGYFLAADREELELYCKKLWKRAGELHKTRRALVRVLAQLPGKIGEECQK